MIDILLLTAKKLAAPFIQKERQATNNHYQGKRSVIRNRGQKPELMVFAYFRNDVLAPSVEKDTANNEEMSTKGPIRKILIKT